MDTEEEDETEEAEYRKRNRSIESELSDGQ
jgi:hypothetical protein